MLQLQGHIGTLETPVGRLGEGEDAVTGAQAHMVGVNGDREAFAIRADEACLALGMGQISVTGDAGGSAAKGEESNNKQGNSRHIQSGRAG